MLSRTVRGASAGQFERRLTMSLAGQWHRISLLVILALAAVLNFTGLSREGYNNQYYAAAVRSMSQSWHNFFFASFDPGGFVTIDKPPLGFWFQVASVKLFGFNGVALLIPQALAGVLAVALLYYLVSRSFGCVSGLIAAIALAVTPISVLTSRNNTIDGTLVLFVLLGAWAVLRAAETGKLRWLLLCAAFVGLGFNIKMLEAYLVVPAFGAVYLLGAHVSLRRRIGHLLVALGVMLAISLSWVTAVDLTPASQRPWVDSTTTNSELDLAIGYNGLQRITGNHSVGGSAQPGLGRSPSIGSSAASPGFLGGSPGGGPGGVTENGPTGPLRLLDTQLGSQIAWLLPLAILGLLLALWQSRPRLRLLDDQQRQLALWGVWLLTTGAFFSVALFFHTYYLAMMAPAVCALAGVGVVALWKEYRREQSPIWWWLPVAIVAGALVEKRILAAYPSYSSWLTPLVLAACVLASLVLVLFQPRVFENLRTGVFAAVVATLALMAPQTVFAAYTTQHTEVGPIVRAGPAASGVSTGFGRGGGGFPRGNGSFGPRPFGGRVPGRFGGGGPPSGAGPPPNSGFGRPFGRGLRGAQVNTKLVTYLEKNRGSAKYLVATSSSNAAAPIIIATGIPVMSLGGFSGSDPILSTATLAKLAKAGEVKYFMLGGGGPGGRGSQTVTTWIQQHSKLVTVAGTELYEYTG